MGRLPTPAQVQEQTCTVRHSGVPLCFSPRTARGREAFVTVWMVVKGHPQPEPRPRVPGSLTPPTLAYQVTLPSLAPGPHSSAEPVWIPEMLEHISSPPPCAAAPLSYVAAVPSSPSPLQVGCPLGLSPRVCKAAHCGSGLLKVPRRRWVRLAGFTVPPRYPTPVSPGAQTPRAARPCRSNPPLHLRGAFALATT